MESTSSAARPGSIRGRCSREAGRSSSRFGADPAATPDSVDIGPRVGGAFRLCMFTPEDVAAISLFSKLTRAELQHVADAAADIHLRPGEYAVNEGEERAFFAVISGKIEVTKRMQGLEKTIGWRMPGTVFGEVPITLGT